MNRAHLFRRVRGGKRVRGVVEDADGVHGYGKAERAEEWSEGVVYTFGASGSGEGAAVDSNGASEGESDGDGGGLTVGQRLDRGDAGARLGRTDSSGYSGCSD